MPTHSLADMAFGDQIIVACDVDGVLADIVHRVLGRYNEEYGDQVTTAHITDWSVSKFVRPECGSRVYGYFAELDAYEHTPAYDGAPEAIREIRSEGHRVVFVTSCFEGTTDQKVRWLQRYDLLPQVAEPEDFIRAKDKSLIRAHLLIDDYPPNLAAWGARGILIDMPYNRDAKGDFLRVKSMAEAVEAIRRFQLTGHLHPMRRSGVGR